LPHSTRPRVRDFYARASALCFAILIGGTAILWASNQTSDVQPRPSIELSAFVTELEHLLAVIPRAQPADLAAVRATIPASWVVQTTNGEVKVPAAWLRRELEEGRRDSKTWPSRRADAVAQLTSLRLEAVALQAIPSTPAASDARATLRDVLQQKEFRQQAGVTLMSRLRRVISDWLVRLWRWLGGERIGRRSTAVVFAWFAGFAALAALGWWVVRTLRTSPNQGRLALTAPPPARKSARAWALQAAAAADPREATRFAYRAAVVRLEEEGAWRADEARTPREHMRLLPASHRRRQLFAEVAGRFEEIWFGGRTPSNDDTRETVARLRELGCLPVD